MHTFTGSSSICHLRSHTLVCIENHLLVVGIGPILNKEMNSIYRYDCMCFYTQVSVPYDNNKYNNVTQSALFFAYKNVTQSV